MAEVSIHRPWNYYGCARKLKVWVDGVEVGAVGTKKTEVFEISDGAHVVQVSMDWAKSVPFQLVTLPGSRAELEVQFVNFIAGMFMIFFAPSQVFSLRPVAQVPIGADITR